MAETAHGAAGADSGFAGFFRSPPVVAINHILAGAAWARDRLRPHAGKRIQLSIAPLAITLVILDSGNVADATQGDSAETRITLTPGTALHMLTTDANAWRNAQVEGDTALARDILHLAQNLHWDIEEDLSRVFGDIVAHRMVRTGNDLRRWQSSTFENLARSAAAYWTEERPLVATRDDVQRYVREVDVLRDDVARAEKRLDTLLRRYASAL
jgi:ubiquinone biosynthesis protein UbiJ